MITKFIRKRNPRTSLPFAKGFARVEVHANGSETFKFKKTRISTPPVSGNRLTTETGAFLNTESGNRLLTD
jgi:hypothetical protein